MATQFYRRPDESTEQFNARVQTYSPSGAITSEQLAPTESLTLPPPQPTRDYSPLASASIEGLLGAFNTPAPEEQKGLDFQNQILDLTRSLGGETQRKQELEAQQGVTQQRTDLQAIVGQLQGLQKEALAIPLQIQQEFAGRGVTAAGVAPIQTGRLRENAIKSLGLAAIGQTLQGNLQLAESSIESAIEAEYAPKKQELEILKQQYELNRESLERTDKKRADALNILLKERERVINDRREDSKMKLQLTVQAASNSANPAPLSVLEAARSSETPLEALSYLSPYLTNPLEVEAQVADLAALKASTALTYANLEKTHAEIAKIRSEAAGQGSISQTNLGEILDNYSLSNEILSDPNLSIAVGRSSILDPRNFIPGSAVQLTKNKINQLIALLSLENRQRLKGSGQISDYESRILAQASTALGVNLSDDDFKKELRKVRGVFATSAGLETMVAVKDPKTGQVRIGPMNRKGIESAVAQGYSIEYK